MTPVDASRWWHPVEDLWWADGMDAERERPPIEPGPEPDTTTAAEGAKSDLSLEGDDQPIE